MERKSMVCAYACAKLINKKACVKISLGERDPIPYATYPKPDNAMP